MADWSLGRGDGLLVLQPVSLTAYFFHPGSIFTALPGARRPPAHKVRNAAPTWRDAGVQVEVLPTFQKLRSQPQPPAWGVFGLTSERKASLRSNTGSGEASRTQAGRRTPLPTRSWAALRLDSPAPGRFLLSAPFFLLRALLLHEAEKESAERAASLGPSQGVTGDGLGRALAWGRPQTRAVMTVLGWARVSVPGSSA